MVAHISTITFAGIDTINIDTQVHFASGQPALAVVGLADKAINESRDRVRAAINSLGLSLPPKRITINLAPADIIKEGSHFDLPIALGILTAMEVIDQEQISNYLALGELSLDGKINKVNGVLPASMAAVTLKKGIIVPYDNGNEASWADENLDIIAASDLLSLINHFKGFQLIERLKPTKLIQEVEYQDLLDIKGQVAAKRALEIAASGGHNLLMIGPPGSGKSMLAARLPGILPELDANEILEVSIINSISGLLKDGVLSKRRPYRDPHHSASVPAMVGGGKNAKPGEVTLAHNGVLFLDELAEYPRSVLDSLRQPTENGFITISRVNAHIRYPAKFQLVAAMNPCKCGYFGDSSRECNKIPNCAMEYQAKISGPMLDRIDIHIEVASENIFKGNVSNIEQNSSKMILPRVIKAREIQRERYKEYGFKTNSEISGQLLEKFAIPNKEGLNLLHEAMDKFKISMRGYAKILRVARTIADMENVDLVNKNHISETLSYRHNMTRKHK